MGAPGDGVSGVFFGLVIDAALVAPFMDQAGRHAPSDVAET
jgi:hypothetical protein